MLKKILSMATTIILLCTTTSLDVYGNTVIEPIDGTFRAEVEAVNGRSGETVTVNIKCTENPGVTGWSFLLSYDDSALRLDEVTHGDIFGELINSGNSEMPFVITWANNQELIYKTGIMASVKFTILDGAKAENVITIEAEEGDFYGFRLVKNDSGSVISVDDVDVPFVLSYGMVKVKKEESPVKFLKGDVNNDGDVTARDLVLATAHVKGVKLLNEGELMRGDIDGDGNVSARDLTALLAHVKSLKLLT